MVPFLSGANGCKGPAAEPDCQKTVLLIDCWGPADPSVLELSQCLWQTEILCVVSGKPQLENYCRLDP